MFFECTVEQWPPSQSCRDRCDWTKRAGVDVILTDVGTFPIVSNTFYFSIGYTVSAARYSKVLSMSHEINKSTVVNNATWESVKYVAYRGGGDTI